MKSRKAALIVSYVYFVLNTIISIFLSSFIVRRVGQTSFGVYQTMTAFVAYLILLEFGTGTIMTRNIALCRTDPNSPTDEERKQGVTIFTTCLFLSLIILSAALAFYLLIPTIYAKSLSAEQILIGKKIFVFSVASLFFSFINQTLNGLLLAYEFYLFEKICLLAKLMLRSVLVVILLFVSSNVLLIAIIDALLSLVFLIATIVYCAVKIKLRFSFKLFDFGIFRSIIPLAFALLLQTIVNTANNNVDKFIIGIMMTPDDVSIYAISMTIFAMFSTIASIPTSIFLPKIAAKIKLGISNFELTKSLVQICRLNIIITGLIAFGFVAVGQQFIVILYGENFKDAWLYAVLIMIPMFVNSSNGVIINIVDICKKRHIRSLIMLATTVLNVCLTIAGIRLLGMLGAALATCITLILDLIIINIWYHKSLHLDMKYLFSKSFGSLLIILILSTVTAYSFSSKFENLYLQFFIGGFIFVISALLMYLLFGKNEYEQKLIDKIMKKGSIKDDGK